MNYKVGDKIKFKTEKQRYTIMACDERFIIAQKPFNARKTFLYTLVDLKEGKRGADNYYCRYDYEKREECLKALEDLNKSATKEPYNRDFWLSHRRVMDLDLERVDENKKSRHVFTDINDIYGGWSSVTDSLHEVFRYKNV